MITFVLLALLNGCCIGLCRILNGRMATHHGVLKASFFNHVVGFIFLSLILFLVATPSFSTLANAPLLSWTGGILGVLFVALNSHVLAQLGATWTALLVISGQMLTGIMLELFTADIATSQIIGGLLIVAGVFYSQFGDQVRRRLNVSRKMEAK